VIVTHDIGVGRRADRIVRMRDGAVEDEVYPDHPLRPAASRNGQQEMATRR